MAKGMKLSSDILNKALNRKRFAWVDSVMKDEIPTDIYGSMHSANVNDKSRAACWLKEQGYYVKDAGEGVIQVFKGATLVRQTKMVLELTDPEELLSVAEAATKHANIPPPPWQHDV